MPQQPHQGRSRVKARSLAALSAFDEEVLEPEERDRELRSLSFVVVVESPSSRPDSVTDSNLEFFFEDFDMGIELLDFFLRCSAAASAAVSSFSLDSGGPTRSSPGTLPLRKMPFTVRLVAVATRLAEGGGGTVVRPLPRYARDDHPVVHGG